MSEREKVASLLTQVAEAKGISNYEVICHDDVLRGDGVLSEFYTGDVKNKDTGDLIKTYIKFPPQYNIINVNPEIYINENQFYSTIFPELNRFQREKGVTAPFDNLPEFFCGASEAGNTYLVLENLKERNYVLHEKNKFLDEKQLKLIFSTYGKFHALSFAFKKQNPEKFKEIIRPLKEVSSDFSKLNSFQQSLAHIFEQTYDNLKKISEDLAEKFKPYVKIPIETFSKHVRYKGKYATLTHGDCWSNNMLFKYKDDGSFDDIKLIDFQLIRDSTPINDLSYFFYCGASKNDFDKLEEYLDVYYKSFSRFAKELGNDPETLFPKKILTKEWKENSIWGVMMSLYVWQSKLVKREKIEEHGRDRQKFKEIIFKVWEGEQFQNIVKDILVHAIDYGIF